MAVINDTYILDGNALSILIEVDDSSLHDAGPYTDLRGAKDKVVEYTKDLLGDGLELSRNCAARVVENLKKMDKGLRPDEFQVQFSIKLDSAIGAIITQSTVGAQLQISMKWTKQENDVKE